MVLFITMRKTHRLFDNKEIHIEKGREDHQLIIRVICEILGAADTSC